MQKVLSQIKIIIAFLTIIMGLGIILWIVSNEEIYGRNYMTANLKLILDHCDDVYALFLILLTNILLLTNRKKSDGLTHVFRWGTIAFSFLIFVHLCDLRLVKIFHQPLDNAFFKWKLSFYLNVIAYLLSSLYFILLSVKVHYRPIKITGTLCTLSQLLMLTLIYAEFHNFLGNNTLASNISLFIMLAETFTYASFIGLAITWYNLLKFNRHNEINNN